LRFNKKQVDEICTKRLNDEREAWMRLAQEWKRAGRVLCLLCLLVGSILGWSGAWIVFFVQEIAK
jgi:hypothetical protein